MGLVTCLLIGAGAIALILLVLSRFYYINQWGEVVSKLQEERRRLEDEQYRDELWKAWLTFKSDARALALRVKPFISNLTLSEERLVEQPCAFLTHHFRLAPYREVGVYMDSSGDLCLSPRSGGSRAEYVQPLPGSVPVDLVWTAAGGFEFAQHLEEDSLHLWARKSERGLVVGTLDSDCLARFRSMAYKAMDAVKECDGQRSASEYAALRRLARLVFYGDESAKEFFASLRQSRDFRDVFDELASEARDQRRHQDLEEQREHERQLAEARLKQERELVQQQQRHELELAEQQEPVEVIFPDEVNLRVRPKRWWES